MRISLIPIILFLVVTFPACGNGGESTDETRINSRTEKRDMQDKTSANEPASSDRQESEHASAVRDTAVFAGGCFWCVEAVYEQLDGVHAVEAGYTGGSVVDPTYQQVCSGNTGHAEVARIIFDPTVISFEELLEMFWQAHDPTTLNRQGADIGTQYRSAIFFVDEQQRLKAEVSRETAQKQFDNPIVTEISPLGVFYLAENYHQDYYQRNRDAPYCQVVIRPKLKKLKLE